MKNKKQPEIRFANYLDEWKMQPLKHIVERVTRKNKELKTQLPLTISAQYGLVDQVTYFNKQVASKDMSNYYLLERGEFAYNKSYSRDYPWGAIKRLDNYEMGALSSLYITFKPSKINSDFLLSYYDTNKWHKEVSTRATEGARNHGLLNISANDFLETELAIPLEIGEQESIGSFFKQLDETISLHQQELDTLKQTKQGFLQKMFPKEGASVPEIRLPGFNEDWQLHKLNDVADIIGGGTPKSGINEYWNGDIDWYSPREIGKEIYAFGSQRKITKLGLQKSSAKLLPGNKTILFTSRAGIGDMAILKNDAATNQGFQSLVINSPYDVYFVYSLGFKIKEYALKKSAGSTFQEISGRILGEMNLLLPTLEEQIQIGNFFKQMDRVIVLHQQELDALKQTKKAFLQKMFV